MEELNLKQASLDLLRLVNRTDEFVKVQEKYHRS